MALPIRAMSRLSWRNLWRNYRRTLIMLLAIAVGVWAMIFMTALLRGMVDDMIRQGIGALPGHVQIHAADYRDDPSVTHGMPTPDEALLSVLNSSQVKAWTSRVKVPAMISSEYENRGISLLGVNPDGEIALGFDASDVTEGRFLNGSDDRGIVIGRKLMQRLETRLGKRVVVMSQDPDNAIADRGFRIVGVFKAELESREESIVYAGRDVVQTMLGIGTGVSEIAVLGHDYHTPGVLTSSIRSAVAADREVLSWLELDPYLATMMKVMDGFVLVWMVVIFLALSFGLVNTLMMAVFERVREIGLMRALGMRPSAIVYQILIESLLLLALGLLLGNLLAIGTIISLKDGIDISAVSQGMEMMGASSVLYPVLLWPDLVLANTVVIVLGLLTSLLPAWRAAQYRPVEALGRT
ncbi:MAG: ABC transporter permease [Gammaproteobacteria bacterium]|nr:ABC transporter permease [Gammaproteobacteria bacterium]